MVLRDLRAFVPFVVAVSASVIDLNRRVDAHAQHGSLRQLDFLAFGRGDGAAAADQDAGQRALEAAEDAADDRADAGAGADARRSRP